MSKDPNSVDPGLEADLGCQSVGQAPRGNNAFTDEVSGLHSELAKDSVKSRSASHRVSIVPGINIKDPQVDQVQRLINARRPNALPLVIDGDYGPLTRAALTQCDCVKRPPPYGGPDKATLYSLLKGEVNDQKRSVRTEDLTSTKLSVWSLTLEERFVQTLHLVLPKLPMELEGAVKDMLCADAIAMIAGVMVVWSGSHVFGVGAARGFEVLDVGNNLNDYLSMTSAAETQEHLSHASSHLVDIIVKLETEVFLAEVTKASGRISGAARKEPDVQLKPQDRKTDGLDEVEVGKVESEGGDGYDAGRGVVPDKTSAADNTANAKVPAHVPMSQAEYDRIINLEKGNRPEDVSNYLPQEYIDAHLDRFKEEGGAFIVVEGWIASTDPSRQTFQPSGKFVGLKSEMDVVIQKYKESGNDWKVLRDELNLGEDVDLSNERIAYVKLPPDDKRFQYNIPTGNEAGAYKAEWVPGGFTKSCTTEATLDGGHKIRHDSKVGNIVDMFDSSAEILQ